MAADTFAGAWTVTSPGGRDPAADPAEPTRTGGATGSADRGSGSPWTERTPSQLASVSKLFASACTLVLVDRGTVRPDDPITRWLPRGDPAWDAVTVSDLLTHCSGMTHWSPHAGYAADFEGTVEQRVAAILDRPPDGPRGRFRYTSPGFILLGAVLAAAADRPYADLLRESVVEPLGLVDTTIGTTTAAVPVGYSGDDAIEVWDPATMPGTGDVWSTASDLARFLRALHTGDLLSERARGLLHALSVPCPDWEWGGSRVRVDRYAAGHFTGTWDGAPVCLIPGQNPGFQALGLWLPRTSTCVALVTNDDAVDLEAHAEGVLYAV